MAQSPGTTEGLEKAEGAEDGLNSGVQGLSGFLDLAGTDGVEEGHVEAGRGACDGGRGAGRATSDDDDVAGRESPPAQSA
ncbi:MAG TPA: hypothetical protein VF635_14140 [Propionibacteriaceae bacterium]